LGAGAWPDFIKAMHRAVPSGSSDKKGPDRDPTKWALLPGLCCQAAGGDARWTDSLAAAWLLFYIAADIMDSVEDQDEPDPWWQESGPGMAINVASGLYFSASQLLNRLYKYEATQSAAPDVTKKFLNDFLIMCSGQHRDLTNPEPSLDQYWQIAAAKSGCFFGLACQAGARLGTDELNIISSYQRYGYHLGMLIQILDDLEDFHGLQSSSTPVKWTTLKRSLPVVYALQMYSGSNERQLRQCLNDASGDNKAAEEAVALLEGSGVVVYLISEMARHRDQAIENLEQANPQPAAAEFLETFVRDIGPPE